MAVSRTLLLVLCSPVLIACLDKKVPASPPLEELVQEAPKVVSEVEQAIPPATQLAQAEAAPLVGHGMVNAVKVFKENMWAVITVRSNQPVIALFALTFGLVALYDGRGFFQVLVLISVAAVFFSFVLSQLNPRWPNQGDDAQATKYFASLEVGAFIGLAAYKGWEGTQLVLGLVVGLYLFHVVQAVALLMPFMAGVADQLVFIVMGSTLTVALASWGIHERYGAAKVLGCIAPLFGASLIVSAAGYAVMSMSVGSSGQAVPVTAADVPAVFEFWCMFMYPTTSKAVGIFTFEGAHVTLGSHTESTDRVIGTFFMIIIWMIGACSQLSRARAAEAQASESKQARYIDGSKIEPSSSA